MHAAGRHPPLSWELLIEICEWRANVKLREIVIMCVFGMGALFVLVTLEISFKAAVHSYAPSTPKMNCNFRLTDTNCH
jgi:hypothetical protein